MLTYRFYINRCKDNKKGCGVKDNLKCGRIRKNHGIASFHAAIQVLHGYRGDRWLGLLGGIEYV